MAWWLDMGTEELCNCLSVSFAGWVVIVNSVTADMISVLEWKQPMDEFDDDSCFCMIQLLLG